MTLRVVAIVYFSKWCRDRQQSRARLDWLAVLVLIACLRLKLAAQVYVASALLVGGAMCGAQTRNPKWKMRP